MRLFRHLLIAAAGLAFGMGLLASGASAAPVEGKDYKVLPVRHAVEPGAKVSVTEFFWYGCPHCAAFDPSLEKWIEANKEKVTVVRVPVQFDPRFEPEQRLFYTLEAMNRLDLHSQVFVTEHTRHQLLNTKERIMAFAESKGLDKEKFSSIYESFGIASKVRRAKQLQDEYQVDGVPMLVVDGRFVTSPALVGQAMGGRQPEPVLFANTLKMMDFLVARAQTESAAKTAFAPSEKK